MVKHEELENYVSQIHAAEQSPADVFVQAIEHLELSELSLLLEALPIDERCQRWMQIPEELKAQVLVGMRYQARDVIISFLDSESLDMLLTGLDAESLIELSDNLTEDLINTAFRSLSLKEKELYRDASRFDPTAIGRFVDHQIITVPPNSKLKDVFLAIKRSGLDSIDHIYVVDRMGMYKGLLNLSYLFSESDEKSFIRGMIDSQVQAVQAGTSLVEAADQLEHSGLDSLPVVDEYNRLVGRITQRTALWIQKEALESRLMAQAGLKESADMFVPVWRGASSRAVWLGINLLTAFLASWTIGLFENVLSQVVALAVLMPVVASMGGISGTQTLTLIIRGIATGQVTFGNALALAKQELGIAVINGVGWSVLIAVVTYYWFGSLVIGVTIAIAVLLNIVIAALSGVYIPVILDRLKIDPALSGAVILTTVTDVFGFLTFLGLGTLWLI